MGHGMIMYVDAFMIAYGHVRVHDNYLHSVKFD